MTQIERLPDEYFEALGAPKPSRPPGLLDAYRFHLVYQRLAEGSVLDVGVYFGDFLKLARRAGHDIFGTEVNAARKDLANSILGADVTVVDFRNGRLTRYSSDSIDNVVAMEVIEHVPDDRLAVSELCRAAREKVVITVPFREKIKTVLCVHCSQYTPHSGHLNSYDRGAFSELVPHPWVVTGELDFCRPLTRRVYRHLPRSAASISLLQLTDAVSFGWGRWLLVELEAA